MPKKPKVLAISVGIGAKPSKGKPKGVKPLSKPKNIDAMLANAMGKNAGPMKKGRPPKFK